MKLNKHARHAIIMTAIFLGLFLLFLFLHNFLSKNFYNGQEQFFYSLALLLIFIFPLSFIYTIIILIISSARESQGKEIKNKNKENILKDIG